MKRNIFNKSFILVGFLLFSLDIYISGFCRGQETRLALDGLGSSTFELLLNYYSSICLLLIIMLAMRIVKNKYMSMITSILALLLIGYVHCKINYYQGVFYGDFPYAKIGKEILLLNTISMYWAILLGVFQIIEIIIYFVNKDTNLDKKMN